MKLEKAEAMFRLMKHYGVAHFKDDDGVEIKFGEMAPAQPMNINPTQEIKPKNTKKAVGKPVPLQAVPPVDSKIPHHINEVANLLKLDDNSLVEKLFPDPSQPSLPLVGNNA